MTATELCAIVTEEVEAAMKADGVWPEPLRYGIRFERHGTESDWYDGVIRIGADFAESLLAWPLVKWLAGRDGVDWVEVSNHPPHVGIERDYDTAVGKIGSTYFTALVAAYMAERGRK